MDVGKKKQLIVELLGNQIRGLENVIKFMSSEGDILEEQIFKMRLEIEEQAQRKNQKIGELVKLKELKDWLMVEWNDETSTL